MSEPRLARKVLAEAVGSAALLAAVVGSGIMGERLAGGNVAIALLANTLATGAALVVLILALGPISGAHLNPAVTMVELAERRLAPAHAIAYMGAQLLGAVLGVMLAHGMFEEPLLSLSTKVRAGPAQLLAEVVATFGLVMVIAGVSRHRPAAVPAAVGLYIASAYWFTASTSFANPAVTLARSLTNTFAGIQPADAPGFIGAQLVGAALAVLGARLLFPRETR